LTIWKNFLEWSVQRLYLQRSYAGALRLAVEILHASGVELGLTSDTSAALAQQDGGKDIPTQAGTLSKNEARDREMLDVAVRCAIKLGDRNAASDLAEATRSRVCPRHSRASLDVKS
jgi:hypothetical protein